MTTSKEQRRKFEIEQSREKQKVWLKKNPKFAKLLRGDYSDYGLKMINGCDMVPLDYGN